MEDNIVYMCLLLISTAIILLVNIYIKKSKTKNQLTKVFSINFGLVILWNISLILQICFSEHIQPIYFDYIAYIGICFLPLSMLFTGKIFANTKIKFTKKYLLLFIIPVISLLVLWTNDFHHLFYEQYSTNFRDAVFGSYFNIHTVYSYVCIAISIIYLLSYSIKNSGFFSKPSLLICTGAIISLVINIVATFGILNLSIYITPISFAIEILFMAFAIFKFNILRVAPIALQKIVDRISDAYIVINEENNITDFNKTFLNIFSATSTILRNKNILELVKTHTELNIDLDILTKSIEKAKTSDKTVVIEKHVNKIKKDFHIEINRIETKGNFLGILILLKDVTQHNIDMQTIKNNQDMLIERERLASLGQMIGGIAHNLKTPIMSIAGAAEGLTDLIKEYDSSIGDKDVTEQDHHDIAKDMQTWVEKVKDYTAYMSDVITAVKGQAVTLSEEQSVDFTIEELVKRVNILMKHELKNALVTLNVDIQIDDKTELKGNINSLVQVVNNMISNAIQSYQGKPDEKIDMSIYKKDNDVVIKIEDYGCGLPKKVQDKLFKEMITTKGKNGTGLGLFMSYSNIRAHFSGNINFETEEGNGTTFYIYLPLG